VAVGAGNGVDGAVHDAGQQVGALGGVNDEPDFRREGCPALRALERRAPGQGMSNGLEPPVSGPDNRAGTVSRMGAIIPGRGKGTIKGERGMERG
jgi:hypothetical protein